MVIRNLKILVVVIQIVLLLSCDKSSFTDFFIGSQPTFVGDHKFVPGLNIYGVLRPDSIDSFPLSFVHVEKAIAAVSNKTDSFPVSDASVVIYKILNNTVIDSNTFTYRSFPVFDFYEYRPEVFKPVAGEHYRIICRAAGLPELTSETVIPSIPKLENDTIITSGGDVKFSIINDSTADLYDIYYYSDGPLKILRKVPSENKNINIEFHLNAKPKKLIIYSYDKNMAVYFAASNLSFKPNTYRPPFTNVHGGYGSFGSMNIYTKEFR